MENVMLNSNQTQIKIVDFGLSNVWSADNPLRTHCGSPEYAAPELFVTGKEYGAEVDLWSLGIILYGMVVGQLPFVSTRNDHIPSQERRNRLVAQINKGLASQHRRAIASFSTDFRTMMNKLLIADAAKRITIKELIVHPWITEQGKKTIRTNPIKPLNAHWQANIVCEIGSMLEANVDEIMLVIEKQPYGKVGGIFNILLYKHTMSQLYGDGVTRTAFACLEANRPHSVRKETTTPTNVTEKFRQQKIYHPTSAPAGRECSCSPNVPELLERQHKSNHVVQNEPQRKSKNATGNKLLKNDSNKLCLKPLTNQNVDYRTIKSPSLRRKAYSATVSARITPDSIIEKCKHILQKDPNKPKLDFKWNPAKSPVKKDSDAVTRPPTTAPKPETPRRRPLTATQVQSEKSQSKSEPAASKKRAITGPPNNTAERILKRSSVSPMKVSQSVSKPSPAAVNQKGSVLTRKPSEQKEKSPKFASGDGTPRPYTSPTESVKKIRKGFIYDPIARSIAGYVVNNVPDKLHYFSWLKNKLE